MKSLKRLSPLLRLVLAVFLALGVIAPALSPQLSVNASAPDPSSADVPAPAERPTVEREVVDAEPAATTESSLVSSSPVTPTIHLKSRSIVPSAANALTVQGLEDRARRRERVHVLVQLDFIPRQAAKEALEDRGLKLLAYVPDYAWIASVSVDRATSALQSPGVAWTGELAVEDKLDPAIVADRWGEWNRAPDGTVAVYVAMHQDESLDTGRALVEVHDGKVMGEVRGIKTLIVEMPQANVRDLAAEDAVQWIEPAAPPLREANDGIRPQIGVDVVQEAPYDLDGSGVDILIYDSGTVTPTHADFSGRLTIGDGSSVRDHSTHVAGTAAGSGSLSASAGGSALQWRGMAPGANVVSYGYEWDSTGMLFYDNPGDIEDDWAQAQNLYGADVGNASLSSNIYSNYPMSCTLMGNYGTTSVLMDQIVRGGNSQVGIGDKYIATWAAGNERGSPNSCGTYETTSPPSGAKNPIHVGASNTNDDSMAAFSSWGPTDDGRVKPIVVAGGEQIGGDGGIMSTIPNMYTNWYWRNCDGSGDDYCYPYDTMQGTSMAAPAVAGSIALMLQHYRDVYSTSGRFWPSTAKAILMQTASDEGNPGPDYQWGYGQVDIHAAVDLISRRAFRQDNVDDGDVDVYSFIVPNGDDDLRVSLAWDDYEATFNADPALINDLDLELVAPDGTVWEPWVLDPDNPANNATRGVNGVDNQEQVEVPAADVEIGTWLVRVHGTEVPEGPQDYSLACEGCESLDLGVCQAKVDGTSATALATTEKDGTASSDLEAEDLAVPTPEPPLTEGGQWQRELEAQAVTQEEQATAERESAVREGLEALEAARQEGPKAVVALLDTLRGPALDAALDEIQEAQERLAESTPPPPETAPVSEAEEKAALETQAARDAQNRAEALSAIATDPAEGKREGESAIERESEAASQRVSGVAADLTVGSGCDHATIGAAIAAANPGDTLLIEGGVTFNENVVIPISLTLQGGYNGCDSGSSSPTTVDGGAGDRVFEIYRTLDVTLENLIITNGNTGLEGGGIRFAAGAGTGSLTLNNVDIHNNIGLWGGGLWVGPNAEVTGYDVQIYENTASAYGGGLRLFGGRATLENSNIYDNTAPRGGGVYGTQEDGHSPVLDLPASADLYDNQALTGDGFGGGLYMRQGTASLADCSDLYSNDATVGGGAYLITSTLTIDGSCSEVNYNTATSHGGGVYAQGSAINLDEDAEIMFNNAGTGGSGSGGGAYLDDSDLYSDKASVNNNTAQNYGGGVYAVNGSRFDMDLGSYTCLGPDCSRLYNNMATGNYGGGVYLNGSYAWLDNTFVENNRGTLGGGIYAYESSVYVNNSLFARNNASSGTGDGVRLYIGASMTGSGNTFAYNESGGVATGRAIDLSSASLTLGCSVIWGHTSSINVTGEDVTYSDVQGGYAGEGNVDVNPLFVSSAGQDYHLQTTSPVIDRCTSGGSTDFDNERRPIVRETAASPYDMGADEVSGAARVGLNDGGCAYATIQQAVNAAQDGDTLQVAEGVYFETVDIYQKDITLEGGYAEGDCTTADAGTTRVEGGVGSDSTFDVDYATVTLRDIEVAWGSGSGGGVQAGNGAQVTLDNADVHDNHGSYGGGVYVGSTSAMTLTNDSDVHDNTASIYGGGARVWGQFVGYNSRWPNGGIYGNCAPDGGGFSVPGGELSLSSSSVYQNEAADATGKGGGIHATDGGDVTLLNGAYVYYLNTAYDGAGIYADDSTVYLEGAVTTIRDNVAEHYGGGVYLTNGSTLHSVGARIGQPGSTIANEAQRGAGIYVDGSTVEFDGGRIINNIASDAGGGVYAEGSTLNLINAQVGGLGAYEQNTLGPDGYYGSGLYLEDTQATLSNTVVISNTFQGTWGALGGGVYLIDGSDLNLINSRIEHHRAWALFGAGAGVYATDSAITLDNSQVISNTAYGGGGGLWMDGTSSLDILNDSLIRNNMSTNGAGGGIYATDSPDINVTDATLSNNTASTDGGAVYINAGTLDLRGGWTLRENTADGNGGAIAVVGTAAANFVAERYSLVYFNRALGGHGGMVYLGSNTTGRLYATSGYNMYVYANSASENGGALYANNGGYFDIYGQVLFDHNRADNGGAVYLSNGSRVWLDDHIYVRPRLWDNRAENGSGGAVYALDSPSVQCDGATLGQSNDGNQASVDGGAIYLSGSTLRADNCIFQGNRAAEHGGAIAAYTSTLDIHASLASTLMHARGAPRSPAAPLATGCDPSAGLCSAYFENVADSNGDNTGDGGAIYNDGGTLSVNHTTLYTNTAYRGGAIYQTGAGAVSRVKNTLIYSNTSTANFGAGIRTANGTFTVTHVTLAHNQNGAGYSQSNTNGYAYNSIAWGNDNGGFWITSGPLTGTCNTDESGNVGAIENPNFVDPGAGEDYHLQGDSPAIDQCADGLSADLDNISRPVPSGGLYDMGAYEYPYAVAFAPDNEGIGLPGTVITYAHVLTNAGGAADTFTLTAESSQGWTVTTDPSPTVTLSAGAATPVVVSVTVPGGILSSTVDTAVVTATSAADPALSAAVVDTTTVGFAPNVTFAPNHIITQATPGTHVYTHTLTNVGNHTDTFNLAFSSSAGWGNLDTPGPFELGPMASTVVTVTVTVPTGVAESDTSVVTATSDGGAGPAVVKDTTSAFSPDVAFAPDDGQTVSPDIVVIYTHMLTNTGTATDTFHLAWDSSQGWATLLDPGPFTLGADETETVRVQVTVPPGTAGMTDTTVVTATSSGGAEPATVRDTTAVFAADVAFAPDYDEMVAPGASFTYTHHLTNTGDGPDTLDVGLAASSEGWTTLLDNGPFALDAGEVADVRVRVDVPGGAGGLTDVTVVTATSRAGALSGVSAAVTDTTFARRTYGVTFAPDYNLAFTPGTVHTYTHQLTNTGNGTDTFALAFATSEGWATLLDSGPFTLTAGSDAEVRVRVDVPVGSGGMEDVATVIATSQLSPTISTGVTDTTTSIYNPGTTLEPDYDQSVMPGTALTHTHWLTNSGTGADWFELDFASSQGWATLLDSGPFNLDAGEGITLNVRVDVPAGSGGLVDTAVLTATSQTGELSATATDVTTATFVAGVEIAPDNARAVSPGSTYVHIHTLTNTGNGPDTFALDFDSSHGRSTLLDPGPVTLGADETAEVRVSVTAPADAISGTLVDVAVVTATSQADAGIFDAATDTTTAAFAPGMDFEPDHLMTGASPNDTFTYTHWLTNSGNYTDTFELDFDSSAGWGSLLDSGPFDLGVGEATSVRVEVTVPPDGADESDTSVVTATSQGGAGPLLVRDTTAAFDPGVAFVPDHSQWLNPGESYTYTHWLTNTGTATDTIALSLDSSQGWAHLMNPGPFTLAAGEAITVGVRVTAPVGSGGLTDVTVVDAATLNGAGPSAQVTDTTTVTYTPDVALGPDHADTVPAGSVIQYTHRLTNTGDGPDTFSLAMESSQGWATLLITQPLALAAGEAAPVQVEVAVPTDTLPFEVDITAITATAAVGGVSATATDTTTVACESIAGADFNVTPKTVIANRPVTFTGRVAAGSPTITYEWDFDDGTSTQTGNPIAHTFASIGAYTVAMTVTNPCPSTEIVTKTVSVVNAPDITVDPLELDVIQVVDQVATHTLTIGNDGTVNLTWNMTESPAQPWLSESPLGGSVGPSGVQVVDIILDTNGLAEDVYTTTLRIGSNDPDELLVTVPVTMTVVQSRNIYLPLVMRTE